MLHISTIFKFHQFPELLPLFHLNRSGVFEVP